MSSKDHMPGELFVDTLDTNTNDLKMEAPAVRDDGEEQNTPARGSVPEVKSPTAEDAPAEKEPAAYGLPSETEPLGESKPPTDSKDDDPWQTVLTIGNDYDKELIDNWKDELNNLLIFAGLFSAVVTAFTVESYQWLQEDPADASVRLLTQISRQLSSFTVTSGFINATTNSILPPDESALPSVSINVLWFISLTLSLVSALYAIAVQQWLRQMTIPRHLLPQDAVRLRQWRYSGLMAWQVPNIIAILPLLIQVAVILFLVGLLLLLHSLNHAVATAFTIAAGISLILFAVTILCPLITPWCPYKSPLIPSVLSLFQWSTAPVIGAMWLTVWMLLIGLLIIFLILQIFIDEDRLDTIFEPLGNGLYLISENLLVLINPTTIGLQRFWTDRETIRLSAQPPHLVVPALSQALATPSESKRHFSQLHQAFLALSNEWRIRCTLFAAAATIGFQHVADPSLEYEEPLRRLLTRLIHTSEDTAGASLHDNHVTLMVETLRSDSSKEDWFEESADITLILLLLYLATKGGKLSPHLFYSILIEARLSQRDDFTAWASSDLKRRISTTLICMQLYSSDDLVISHADAQSMVNWAVQSLQSNNDGAVTFIQRTRRGRLSPQTASPVMEYILAATAIAFKALTVHSDRTSLETLLQSLSSFLDASRTSIISTVKLYKPKHEQYLLFVTPQAIHMICQSLAALASAGLLPLDPDCKSKIIAERLEGICSGQEDYADARNSLATFWQKVGRRRQASRWMAVPDIRSVITRMRNIRATGTSDHQEAVLGAVDSPVGARRSLVPCHSLMPMQDFSPRDNIVDLTATSTGDPGTSSQPTVDEKVESSAVDVLHLSRVPSGTTSPAFDPTSLHESPSLALALVNQDALQISTTGSQLMPSVSDGDHTERAPLGED